MKRLNTADRLAVSAQPVVPVTLVAPILIDSFGDSPRPKAVVNNSTPNSNFEFGTLVFSYKSISILLDLLGP